MSDLTLVIGNKNYSSWSMRPWLALKAAGLAFDEIVIPLYEPGSSESIRTHSPSGKVPVLKHGPITVWDSLAITEYVAELPGGAGLWPADTARRAHARSIVAEMHAGFQTVRRVMPMNVRACKPGRERSADMDAEIARIANIWHECRTRFGVGGPFLFGSFTAADAMYAPVVSRFATYGLRLDGICRAYTDAILAFPPVVEWFAAARAEPWTIARLENPED